MTSPFNQTMTPEQAQQLRTGDAIIHLKTGQLYTVIGKATGSGPTMHGKTCITYRQGRNQYARLADDFAGMERMADVK